MAIAIYLWLYVDQLFCIYSCSGQSYTRLLDDVDQNQTYEASRIIIFFIEHQV